MPVVRRMSDALDPLITVAIERATLGEDIDWEAFPTQVPDGSVGYAICFWLRGPIIGQKLPGVLLVTNPTDIISVPTEEAQERMDMAVRDFLTNLIGQRSQALNGHGKSGPTLVPPSTGA